MQYSGYTRSNTIILLLQNSSIPFPPQLYSRNNRSINNNIAPSLSLSLSLSSGACFLAKSERAPINSNFIELYGKDRLSKYTRMLSRAGTRRKNPRASPGHTRAEEKEIFSLSLERMCRARPRKRARKHQQGGEDKKVGVALNNGRSRWRARLFRLLKVSFSLLPSATRVCVCGCADREHKFSG